MPSAYEAHALVQKINNNLTSYGYEATSIGPDVDYALPWHSTARVLAEIGAVPLACCVKQREEIGIFAVPQGVKTWRIKETFREKSKQFRRRYGLSLIYPQNIKVLRKTTLLPENIASLDWEYTLFLLREMATASQIKLYEFLYDMVKLGLPFRIFETQAFSRIANARTGIPVRTVEKQVTVLNPPLHIRFVRGYLYKRLGSEAEFYISQ